jgi:ABC-type uncharacterized transport system ATPase component
VGLVLIALVGPARGAEGPYRISVSRFVEHPALDAVLQGFQDYLQENGLPAEFRIHNAQANMATAGQIGVQIMGEAPDLILAMRRGRQRGLRAGVRGADRRFFRQQLRILGLGLEERMKTLADLLSGGQRQALSMVMATLVHPDVLLLDEHTAALDPKTARDILGLTRNIVESRELSTLMVTHNMKQALELGNRLVMLHRRRVILDLAGEEKRRLSVDDLLTRFFGAPGEVYASDRALLC